MVPLFSPRFRRVGVEKGKTMPRRIFPAVEGYLLCTDITGGVYGIQEDSIEIFPRVVAVRVVTGPNYWLRFIAHSRKWERDTT